MEDIISLCKRRGFIYQGSEIYGGLAGTWDYGPLGVALKKNIENLWWKRFVLNREDMYGIDAAILMNQEVWKSSGHVAGFADPLMECKKCKKRFRADHLENKKKCPECGGELGEEKMFNMMFKTQIGATEDESSISYLRPETAQGMFVNFKNVVDSFHPKLPFGLAQTGKAFRNEIAPRDFIFRVRELEQMEIEYFVKPSEWEVSFEHFRNESKAFFNEIGLPEDKVHELEIAPEDLAHYSKRTIDFEFEYPFGRKELSGLAYRTDFDLKAHSDGSKVDLSYFDETETDVEKKRYIPHCIEPSFGVGRAILAVLSSAYSEDELGGEKRAYLKLAPSVAPYLVAVFPLLKNKPELIEKSREVFNALRKNPAFAGRVIFDETGSIGKRYRRQDEIGTPYCVTVDFDTLGENPEHLDTVTVRNRDSGEQKRVKIVEIDKYLSNII